MKWYEYELTAEEVRDFVDVFKSRSSRGDLLCDGYKYSILAKFLYSSLTEYEGSLRSKCLECIDAVGNSSHPLSCICHSVVMETRSKMSGREDAAIRHLHCVLFTDKDDCTGYDWTPNFMYALYPLVKDFTGGPCGLIEIGKSVCDKIRNYKVGCESKLTELLIALLAGEDVLKRLDTGGTFRYVKLEAKDRVNPIKCSDVSMSAIKSSYFQLLGVTKRDIQMEVYMFMEQWKKTLPLDIARGNMADLERLYVWCMMHGIDPKTIGKDSQIIPK